MNTIIANALKERLRRKELYIVLIIGGIILLLFSTENGGLSVDGKQLTGFDNMYMVMFIVIHAIGCLLAVILSIGTIPNEYKRQNSHLVWVRGISQFKYHCGLSIANSISTLIAVGILYLVLDIYAIVGGHGLYVLKMIPAFVIVAISISIVSLFTSVLSIIVPMPVVALLSAILTIVGVFYGLFDLLKSSVGGLSGKCIGAMLTVVPNLNGLRAQAYNLVIGKEIDIHILLAGLLALYIISLGLLVFKKKEA